MRRWRPRSWRAILTNFRRLSLSRSAMDFQPTCSGSQPKPRPRMTERAGRALAIASPALGQVHPLSPDKAFLFSAKALDAQTVEARFTIADGYYLYRDKI